MHPFTAKTFPISNDPTNLVIIERANVVIQAVAIPGRLPTYICQSCVANASTNIVIIVPKTVP